MRLNFAITRALPRSSIAQGDDAAKERVRDFLKKRSAKVQKT
ncbi:MAG: hypothetical protein V4792_10610 [Pseudomonadota bacterium]